MKWLDRDTLESALKSLGQKASREGIELQLCLYGGSAMLLAYDSRNATKDVDAVLNPADRGMALASEVARELGLHSDWLNDDIIQFLGPEPAKGRRKLDMGFPGLNLHVATASYLLAMKTISCRRPLPGYRGDQGDLVFLLKKMEIKHVKEIQLHLDKHFPDESITPEKRSLLETLIEEAHHD